MVTLSIKRLVVYNSISFFICTQNKQFLCFLILDISERYPDLYNLLTYWWPYLTLTHLDSGQPKQAWQIWKYFANNSIFLKTSQGEMFIRSQATTFLQIFFEFLLFSSDIYKSMRVADNTFYSVNGIKSHLGPPHFKCELPQSNYGCPRSLGNGLFSTLNILQANVVDLPTWMLFIPWRNHKHGHWVLYMRIDTSLSTFLPLLSLFHPSTPPHFEDLKKNIVNCVIQHCIL